MTRHPSTPTVWALCALSRPYELLRVIHEFQQQTCRNKRIAIIENREGLGACAKLGVFPDLLLHSESNQTIAKNVGLAALREIANPNDYWATWDDDDRNGPGRLEEVAKTSCGADVLGKASFFMRLADGRLLQFTRPPSNLWGGTLAARIGCSTDFPEVGRWGEDEAWLQRMCKTGARIGNLSQWHFVAVRKKQSHAWSASDEQVINCIAGGRPNVIVNDYGKVDDGFVFSGFSKPLSNEPATAPFSWDLSLQQAKMDFLS